MNIRSQWKRRHEEETLGKDTDPRGRRQVVAEAEVRAMRLQSGGQPSPANHQKPGGSEEGSRPAAAEGAGPCRPRDWGLPDSRAGRGPTSVAEAAQCVGLGGPGEKDGMEDILLPPPQPRGPDPALLCARVSHCLDSGRVRLRPGHVARSAAGMFLIPQMFRLMQTKQ